MKLILNLPNQSIQNVVLALVLALALTYKVTKIGRSYPDVEKLAKLAANPTKILYRELHAIICDWSTNMVTSKIFDDLNK